MKTITESSLVLWLFCYLCGIVCGLSQHWIGLLVGAGVLFYCGLLFSRSLPKLKIYLLTSPIFFILGLWSMEISFPQQNKVLTLGENFYIGTIQHVASDNKLWNTNIVRLSMIRNGNNEWIKSNEYVLLLIENESGNRVQTFQQNDKILFKTTFREVEQLNNVGEFNIQRYWHSKGIRYQGFTFSTQVARIEIGTLSWFEHSLNTVRTYSTKVLDRWIGVEDSPLLKALLLGDKSDLDTDTKRIFMNTGAMHMLAVSGMHVGLIVVVLEIFFKALFFHRWKNTSSTLMIIILWFYAFLTGFSASVTRAVVMFTVLILSRFLKRKYQAINSLCIAAFVILVYNPMSVFDIGFQLSFLAMVGIFTIYPFLQNILAFKQTILNTLWQGTAVGLAAQVFTLPLSLYYFHQFPNYFILTNIGVMLFSGILLGLAIALLLIGKIPFLSVYLGWVVALCAWIFIGFIAFVEKLPGALALGFSPSMFWITILYGVILLSLYWIERKKWITILVILLPLLAWIQFDRLDNIYKKEWVVFNNQHTIILFNNAGQQICFYEDRPKNQKKAHRLVADYQKIHPGSAEFYPITNTDYQIETKNCVFNIKFNKNITNITNNNELFAIVASENINMELLKKNANIITKGIPSRHAIHTLQDGAYRKEW